ncbi:hypothetical protein M8494_03985 [Serratia ureilytica]
MRTRWSRCFSNRPTPPARCAIACAAHCGRPSIKGRIERWANACLPTGCWPAI